LRELAEIGNIIFMRTNFFYPLTFAIVFLFSPIFAATNLVVFSDKFQNNFEDHSWVTHNLTNTSPVHSGKFSIGISSATNWQGLYFYHSNFNSTPYESISFWAHGGTKGGQEIQVQGLLDGKTPSDDTYSRTNLTSNWQHVTVLLEELDVVGKTNFNGFWIQETGESPDSPFYIDDVQLNVKPAPSAGTSTKTEALPVVTSP
jgi:hypothetical protein